jgi:hypothetical protein
MEAIYTKGFEISRPKMSLLMKKVKGTCRNPEGIPIVARGAESSYVHPSPAYPLFSGKAKG